MIAVFFKAPRRNASTLSFRQKVEELDFLGTLVFLPSIICLLVGLQWEGTKYAWSSGRVIAILILAALFAASFVVIQIWKQDKATVPPQGWPTAILRLYWLASRGFATYNARWLLSCVFDQHVFRKLQIPRCPPEVFKDYIPPKAEGSQRAPWEFPIPAANKIDAY